MSDRYQCVQIESRFSSFLRVVWGVPQGSILGPLLFILFINELPNILKKQSATMNANEANEVSEEPTIVVFADDNTPTTSNTDLRVLLDEMQEHCDVLSNWFLKNRMVCSGEKTKLLILGTRANRMHKIENKHFIPKLEICGKTILESECEKLLGLLVNNTITWKNHLHGHEENPGLITTLSKRVGVLSKLRKYMSKSKFKQISAGLFLSKLSYGISVWSGVWNTHIIGDFMKTSIRKRDMKKLQTLRLETCLDRSTSHRDPDISRRQTNCLPAIRQVLSCSGVQYIQKNKKPSDKPQLFWHQELKN